MEIASYFTWLLQQVQASFEIAEEPASEADKPEKKSFFKRLRRGKKGPEKVTIERAFELLGEPIEESVTNIVAPATSDDVSRTEGELSQEVTIEEEPSESFEIATPVSTNTGGWNFKLEIEKPGDSAPGDEIKEN